jgi:hypothetical protein
MVRQKKKQQQHVFSFFHALRLFVYIFRFRYQETFKYVNLRAQHLANRRGSIDKEYIWPDSFLDCTLQLSMYSVM